MTLKPIAPILSAILLLLGCGQKGPAEVSLSSDDGGQVIARLFSTSIANSSPVPFLTETRTLEGRSYRVATLPAMESSLHWPVSVPPDARLRFGYALMSGEDQGNLTLDLAVRFRDDSDSETVLWKITEASTRRGDEFREVELDLRGYQGEGELIFTTRSHNPGTENGGAVVNWFNPLLLRPSAASPRKLVVICIDTLRADRLNSEHMPHLSARLESAAVFDNAYANSPWSLPSITTILTGLVPGEHQAGRRTDLGPAPTTTNYNAATSPGGIELIIGGRRYRFQMLHPSKTTIQELLGEAGFVTGAIHNNGYINWPTRALRGMDHIQHYKPRDAAVGTELGLGWLEDNASLDFFLFLHYIDPHQWPVRIPSRLQGKSLKELSAEERHEILGVYDDLVKYTDREVERFFQRLEETGMLQETYVVLLADHGERFFEDGVVGSHGGGFQESVIRVPLAFWGPGIIPSRHGTRVSLADVVPTLLDLLGIPDSQDRSFGTSLRSLLDGEEEDDHTVVSEFVLWSQDHAAWLEGPWKLIWYPQSDTAKLFDLREGTGPLMDRSADHPEVVARLKRRLGRHLRSSLQAFRSLSYEETRMDVETLESLKALGYIE